VWWPGSTSSCRSRGSGARRSPCPERAGELRRAPRLIALGCASVRAVPRRLPRGLSYPGFDGASNQPRVEHCSVPRDLGSGRLRCGFMCSAGDGRDRLRPASRFRVSQLSSAASDTSSSVDGTLRKGSTPGPRACRERSSAATAVPPIPWNDAASRNQARPPATRGSSRNEGVRGSNPRVGSSGRTRASGLLP